MSKWDRMVSAALTLLAVSGCSTGHKEEEIAGSDRYEDLVKLFQEWRAFQKPRVTEGVPDYTAAAMEEQRKGLARFQSRLAAIDYRAWPVSQQIDYHLVRAEMNGLDFDRRVLRPWSRDPCFYTVVYPSQTDVPAREGPVLEGALELWQYEFPLPEGKLAEFRTKLQAIPKILEQAKGNLVEEARDLWFLGMRVKKSESVVLADLAKRLGEHHPDLVPDVERARRAVEDLHAWLGEKQSKMTAPSGIGIENYNWYLEASCGSISSTRREIHAQTVHGRVSGLGDDSGIVDPLGDDRP